MTLLQINGSRIKAPSSKLLIFVSFCCKTNVLITNALSKVIYYLDNIHHMLGILSKLLMFILCLHAYCVLCSDDNCMCFIFVSVFVCALYLYLYYFYAMM